MSNYYTISDTGDSRLDALRSAMGNLDRSQKLDEQVLCYLKDNGTTTWTEMKRANSLLSEAALKRMVGMGYVTDNGTAREMPYSSGMSSYDDDMSRRSCAVCREDMPTSEDEEWHRMMHREEQGER